MLIDQHKYKNNSPSDAGDISPLDGEEKLFLLVGQVSHLAMGSRGLVLVRHAVNAVTLQVVRGEISNPDLGGEHFSEGWCSVAVDFGAETCFVC